MASSAPVTQKEILARRRGRRFAHNAVEEVPEDLRATAAPEGDESDGGDASPTVAPVQTPAAPPPAQTPAAPAPVQAPAQPSQDALMLQQALADRMALEQRLRDQEAVLSQRQEQIRELEERSGELGALQNKFKETEAELAQTRRTQFEKSIERDIEDRVNKLLADDADGQYSHDTARALVTKVMGPTISTLMNQFNDNERRLNESFSAKLAETQKGFDSRINEIQSRRSGDLRAALNKAILEKFPKFSDDIKSQDFAEFGAKSPRFSLDNYSTLIAKAYEANDLDRVVDIMNEFGNLRQGKKDALESMADVQIGQVSASQPATTKQEVTYSYEDIGNARRKLQSGDMTRAQFKAFKESFEKAEKENRIKG